MKLKIAIMGTRGIPANYGGFETFAEALGIGLAERGHDVTVYCRSNTIQYEGNHYRGVRLVVLPTIRHKYFDTVAHTFLSVLHGLTQRYDAVLVCNSINSIFCFIPRLGGQPVAINVDGLEWQRAKWNWLGKWMYRFSEWMATFLPSHVVTDSKTIQAYYARKFHRESTFIPYGASTKGVETDEILRRYGLERRGYVLYVSRLEPENNAHEVVAAFEKTKTDLRLVMVGDAPYSDRYIRELKNTRDPRILFTGYVFGQGYRELQSNAYLYVQATEVGGTHPALLEGMGYGNCVLANDVPEHREVLEDAGFYFDLKVRGDLKRKLQYLIDHPDDVATCREKALARIEEAYTWERIISDYEKLFVRLAGGIR